MGSLKSGTDIAISVRPPSATGLSGVIDNQCGREMRVRFDATFFGPQGDRVSSAGIDKLVPPGRVVFFGALDSRLNRVDVAIGRVIGLYSGSKVISMPDVVTEEYCSIVAELVRLIERLPVDRQEQLRRELEAGTIDTDGLRGAAEGGNQ